MMHLDTTHQILGWPSRGEVLKPSGAGPAIYARLLQSKLGIALERRIDVKGVRVGVLAAHSMAHATEPPLAVVCEFKAQASDAAIEEAHRLAWNFCRSPLLVTLEPHLVRSWTTCERPRTIRDGRLPETEIEELRFDPRKPLGSFPKAARGLSWISLVSGQLFREFGSRFPRKKCADETLLQNLTAVRGALKEQGLSTETIHDLLARLMFVQFLFHRKDEQGRAALTPEWLARQYKEVGSLSCAHDGLESVLRNHADSYALFKMLNERFNGDLFPGKATDPEEREVEWRTEMQEVLPKHLDLLADFVGGSMEIGSGQRSLWPLYSFDVIPLEFISSIYEAFVTKDKGTHYTPGYLVDVVLDTCLPWASNEWDVKVLDPACGSGIFLVKAFQRLVHRWRRAQKGRKPDTDLLRKLLTENLYGIDIKREAVRVACFSLYLAMCDELEPRYVWDRVKFPRLRGTRLIEADFFREDIKGFRTLHEREHYDVVVGNAPWGSGTVDKSEDAEKWGKKYHWPVSYKNIGPLFLAKGAKLAKTSANVSMLQSSGLLFNSTGTAVKIRKKLFAEHGVKEIVNLAALRFGLFANAVGASCVVCLQPTRLDGEAITYVSPKPSYTVDDSFRIVFDAYDYHSILPQEVQRDHGIWTALMWGSRRDYELIQRLGTMPSIEKLEAQQKVKSRTGIIRGSDPTKQCNEIVGRRIFDAEDFPRRGFPYIDAVGLPVNTNPFIHYKDSVSWEAFDPMQLLIKLAWRRSDNRFHARIVLPDGDHGALCSTSYVSARFPKEMQGDMEAACLVYNSRVAVYYLLHTSSRFASFRQEVNADELLRVPIPPRPMRLGDISTPEEADSELRTAFGFKAAEWMLIEDACDFKLAAFNAVKRPRKIHGSFAPHATDTVADTSMLERYGEAFIRVLHAGFGADKRVRVTLYHPAEDSPGAHLVAIHLGWPEDDLGVHHEHIRAGELLERTSELSKVVEQRSADGTTIRRRVLIAYNTVLHKGRRVPTVILCKPNLARYWTRSIAMRDADVVSEDLVRLAAANLARRSNPRG